MFHCTYFYSVIQFPLELLYVDMFVCLMSSGSVANQVFHQILFESSLGLIQKCWPKDSSGKKRKKDPPSNSQGKPKGRKRAKPQKKNQKKVFLHIHRCVPVYHMSVILFEWNRCLFFLVSHKHTIWNQSSLLVISEYLKALQPYKFKIVMDLTGKTPYSFSAPSLSNTQGLRFSSVLYANPQMSDFARWMMMMMMRMMMRRMTTQMLTWRPHSLLESCCVYEMKLNLWSKLCSTSWRAVLSNTGPNVLMSVCGWVACFQLQNANNK